MSKEKNGNWFMRHKVLTVILAIIIIAIIGGAAGGDKKETSNNSNATTSDMKKEKKTETVAKIGSPARDGKFEFTVNSIKCGETNVGNEYLNTKAQGQFCRLNVTIKNIGDKSQSMFADNQKLMTADGKEFSYDSTATIYAAPSGGASSWYDEINPDNSSTGDIIFDLPASVTPATAVLHDSSFSSGAKVSLQ